MSDMIMEECIHCGQIKNSESQKFLEEKYKRSNIIVRCYSCGSITGVRQLD